MLIDLDLPATLGLDALLDDRGRLTVMLGSGTTAKLRAQAVASESMEQCVRRVTEGVNEAWQYTGLRGEHQQVVLARVLAEALARRLVG